MANLSRKQKQVLDAIATGIKPREALNSAYLPASHLNFWQDNHPQFRAALAIAQELAQNPHAANSATLWYRIANPPPKPYRQMHPTEQAVAHAAAFAKAFRLGVEHG